MFLLTLERFLQVYLHLRYINFWINKQKTKMCLISWSVSVGSTVILIILHKTNYLKIQDAMEIASLLVVCLSVAISIQMLFVYSYLYKKYRDSHTKENNIGTPTKDKAQQLLYFSLSFCQFFFLISSWFIIFPKHHQWSSYTCLSFGFNVICDSLIYVFLQPAIK